MLGFLWMLTVLGFQSLMVVQNTIMTNIIVMTKLCQCANC